MRSGAVAGERQPKVLLLASTPEALRAIDTRWSATLSIRVRAASHGPVARGADAVHRLRPGRAEGAARWWALGARAKAGLLARRMGLPSGLLWAVKTDPWLRRELHEVDVVLSADATTDRVLELVPELVGHAVVVRSDSSSAVNAGLCSLGSVLELLESQRPARVVEGSILREPLSADVTGELSRLVDPGQAQLVPPAILPVPRVLRTIRWLAPALGPEHAAEIVVDVLDRFDWAAAPDAGRAGLTAQRASASIWTARDPSLFPPDSQLAEASEAALAGADEALAAGRPTLARARLSDAMTLLFHRERHAETLSSPLVSDPATYLGPLYANRTYREVVAGGSRPRVAQRVRSTQDEGLRVLVLGGAYGAFHEPVAEALREKAAVVVRRPRRLNRFFSRKGMDPQVIDALAALRRAGPSPAEDDWGVRGLTRDLRRALAPRLRNADVVFTDWADRVTVWASHSVPPGCRLVVRIHSLDALHPSFHLVDWSAVDRVIVVSEPLRRLVVAMLQAAGAEVPVTVVANLAALREMAQPKDPGARTTLGMVGWGRRVKDPLWALDLLARNPAWRLVLIGPDLPGRSASAKAYVEEVHRRLADPALRDRVEVVGATDDVAAHLRKVGVILSTSRRESWHLGLVEGAASGAVPVVRNWPLFAPVGGARSLFPPDWVVETVDEAEARIRRVTGDAGVWEEARLAAQREALALYDPVLVAQQYREVILGT